jgi:hypothetical protein
MKLIAALAGVLSAWAGTAMAQGATGSIYPNVPDLIICHSKTVFGNIDSLFYLDGLPDTPGTYRYNMPGGYLYNQNKHHVVPFTLIVSNNEIQIVEFPDSYTPVNCVPQTQISTLVAKGDAVNLHMRVATSPVPPAPTPAPSPASSTFQTAYQFYTGKALGVGILYVLERGPANFKISICQQGLDANNHPEVKCFDPKHVLPRDPNMLLSAPVETGAGLDTFRFSILVPSTRQIITCTSNWQYAAGKWDCVDSGGP